jgi:Holliday junction resolvase
VPRSRGKGKSGEYEIRDLLRAHGFEARRGIASAGEPDIVHEIPGVHLEVKRSETLRVDAWLEQAQQDAGDKLITKRKRQRSSHVPA